MTRPARELDLAALLGAFPDPAALVAEDGLVRLANAAWASAGLPRRLAGESLFLAFRQSGEGRPAAGEIEAGRTAVLHPVGEGWRLALVDARPAAPALDASTLGAILALAPIGAALVEGPDALAGPLIEANPALARLAGRPLIPGERLADLLDPATVREVATGGEGPFEVGFAGAPLRIAQLSLAPAGEGRSLAFLSDISEHKAAQAQLAQRNKMEAIGQLAGGVAHDFNNLLSAIQLRAEELLVRHPLGDPAYESLSEIRATVARAAEVVKQLLTFSRKATHQRETLDLAETLIDLEVLLRRLLREDVRLETRYARDLPLVRIDKAQFENAVMNLVVNARDAIRSGGGSTIGLTARRVSPDEAASLGLADAAAGQMALIEVTDDGPGVPPDVLPSIFDPFFTTKAPGEGTGLGLASVYGAVRQSQGHIVAVSPPGEGASFRIFLPAFIPPLQLTQVEPPAPARRAARDLSGKGLILLVEDEAMVRGITARLLRARGYEVLEAGDGEAALEMAREHAGRIDLMISDVIMPGLDGPALLDAARDFLDGAPVVFISGYAEAEFSRVLEAEPNVSFLPKPLDIKSLAEEVKRRLQERAGA
ncbi:MAG TPA: ATP-binding protein [Caulobacteraceae bacterium]|jgi:two-component system cell cycle sensor histidine kinase/response regulator CckA|nr:ATP-binding protein [Caulobacteraceae bacterium]